MSDKLNLANPSCDQDFFAIGRIIAEQYSTCLKNHTAALIVDRNGEILSFGVNMCCPQGQLYGLPVTECPRMDKTTGTSYALCMPIHAEVVACLNAFGIGTADRKNLWHFPGFTKRLREYAGFFKNKGAVMYLVGHYWACDECIDFAKSVGIDEIKFDDLSGGATLKKYREQGLDHVGNDALDASGSILHGIVTVELADTDVDDFCERNGLDRTGVQPLPHVPRLYIVTVPEGEEQTTASKFEVDEAVKSAKTVSLG